MGLNIHSMLELFDANESVGGTVTNEGRISIDVFRLHASKYINFKFDEVDIETGAECHFILAEGEAEVSVDLEREYLHRGDVYSELQCRNFTIYAHTDCRLICVNNSKDTNIKSHHQKLREIRRKVEETDQYLKGHNTRVGKYTGIILRTLFPEEDWTIAMIAANYHDVGKLVIPAEIVNKPGKLTPEEFEYIKKHPSESYESLKGLVAEEAAQYARWHHEKLDGSGYPDGLKGDEIPLPSRAMAVADIFDALTTARSYHAAKSFEDALAILHQDAEAGKLDGDCVAALEKNIQAGTIVEGVDNNLLHVEFD